MVLVAAKALTSMWRSAMMEVAATEVVKKQVLISMSK